MPMCVSGVLNRWPRWNGWDWVRVGGIQNWWGVQTLSLTKSLVTPYSLSYNEILINSYELVAKSFIYTKGQY